MLERDSTWYRTYQVKQARILFTLGHWFTNLEGTARSARYQDCFSMASKSGALGVVPLFSFRDQKPSRNAKKHTPHLGRSNSPTLCRFNTPTFASRVRQGDRLASCAHAHPHSMVPNGFPSRYFGHLPHHRFVSSWWIQQTGT